MVKLLHFDFDGTIGDTVQCVVASTQAAFRALGRTVPTAEKITSLMGIPLERACLEMVGHALSTEEISEILTTYRSLYPKYSLENIRAFPGIKEALMQAKEAGNYLTIITSKQTPAALGNLKTLGLLELFDVIVGADFTKEHKPNAAPVRKAEALLLEKYGDIQERHPTIFKEAIVFGDSTFDIDMAHNAGLKACAVTWGAHGIEKLEASHPDFIIHKVEDLKKFWS
ncbi:HAD family hydrolase [Acetobacteraceae bacterium]|nr:HAD family hydrolase [Acetobacteraceae bacterium]